MKSSTPIFVLIVVASILTNSGCASKLYKNTPQADLQGKLDVRWVDNDYFIFLPHEDDPLTLTRADGIRITPGVMYTDGGSIPRFLWGVEGYSPWGHAPAYMVHDWLFEAHQCGYAPDNMFSFKDSVDVMAESLKALMEERPEYKNYFVFGSVVTAVASPIAKKLWVSGACTPPPNSAVDPNKILSGEIEPPGELIETISFDSE